MSEGPLARIIRVSLYLLARYFSIMSLFENGIVAVLDKRCLKRGLLSVGQRSPCIIFECLRESIMFETNADTTPLVSVVKEEEAVVGLPPTLGNVLSEAGVAFVDQSFSTLGAILEVERAFTTDLAPQRTALWGTCR